MAVVGIGVAKAFAADDLDDGAEDLARSSRQGRRDDALPEALGEKTVKCHRAIPIVK